MTARREPAAGRFVMVLGASNVSRGLPRLAALLRSRCAGSVDLFVAAGHGRGYGVNTRVGVRRLPSILASGLWRAAERERVLAPAALITDVGNELLYGLGVAAVAALVREAAGRMADRGATLVITGLPLASLARVGAVRDRLMRTAYVPGCLLSLDGIKQAAAWLDDELRAVAAATGAVFIEQPGAWYGFDAMHLKRRSLDQLWKRVCDAWGLPAPVGPSRATLIDWVAIGSRAAEVRSLAGVRRLTPQPVLDRAGLRIWMY